MITLETNFGPIVIELDFVNTPKTAENFLMHAKNGFYNNTIFHRVIGNFMVQGGGFEANMNQKRVSGTVENEAKTGKKNIRGSIAMARTSDPHSAGAQFFINVVDNDFLNFTSETSSGWGYCVFGNVVSGMDVVDQIRKVPTTNRAGHENVPVENVIIQNVIVDETATQKSN